MLYGVNTHSVSAKSWTNIRFSTWINGVSRINKHELSSEHVTVTIIVKIKNHCVPLHPSMEYQKKKYRLQPIGKLYQNLLTLFFFWLDIT